jgi:membrane protein involved in colicin uptake
MVNESFKETLPGTIYQKKNRWWWKVKLPGEDKTRARALKPSGSRFATTDLNEAQEIARRMWGLAIKTQTEAKVRAEAEGKIKSYTEEIAKVRAEAAETISKLKAEFGERLKIYSEIADKSEQKAKMEAEARAKAEAKAQTEAKARLEAEERAALETKARAQMEAKLNEILDSIKGSCECCGKKGIPVDKLVKIDSGQLLCPDCLKALRS